MSDIHKVSEGFDLSLFLETRKLTKEVVNKVRDQVSVGMSEDEGIKLIDKTLMNFGFSKPWHPHKFRIGKNTICSFRDESDSNVRLQEDDIFFIDIGPVYRNYEGDFGDTFVMGNNVEYLEISNMAKEVFDASVNYWQKNNCSGKELYDFSSSYASENGYKLNTKMKGHRLGDFPHHIYFRGGLNEVEETPVENLWILEIHLLNKKGTIGAFFEDIIQRKS